MPHLFFKTFSSSIFLTAHFRTRLESSSYPVPYHDYWTLVWGPERTLCLWLFLHTTGGGGKK